MSKKKKSLNLDKTLYKLILQTSNIFSFENVTKGNLNTEPTIVSLGIGQHEYKMNWCL